MVTVISQVLHEVESWSLEDIVAKKFETNSRHTWRTLFHKDKTMRLSFMSSAEKGKDVNSKALNLKKLHEPTNRPMKIRWSHN